jgi:hypothetical protein
MQNRSYLGTGSPYPTGKSPLVLDIERNIQSVVQQQVENKKTEIKDKRLRVTENEKLMLDALDMQAVEGMGDKVALEFGNELDSLKDTWAKKFYEKGGELNTQDKLNLRKDQSKLEQKLKSAASEIKMMAEVKKELQIQATRPDKRGIYDFYETSKKLNEYEKSGKIGSGNFINVPVMAKEVFGEEFVSKYDDLVKNAAKSTDETIRVLNPNTGLYESRTTNKPTMAQTKEYLMSRPEFQPLIEQDPVKANALVDDMVKANFLNKSEQGFNAGMQRQNKSGSATAEEQDNIDFFNNIAEGVLRADPDILKSLTGAIDKEIGTIASAGYDGGNIILYPTDTKKHKPVTIPLPNRGSKDAVLQTKRKVLGRLEMVGGRLADKTTMNAIQADWDKLPQNDPDMPLTLKSVVNQLGSSPDEVSRRSKAANPDNVVTPKDYQQRVIDAIKKSVPDAIVLPKEGRFFGTNKDVIRFYQGKTFIGEYNLTKESDRNELSDAIIENSKYKEKFNQKFGYSKTETPKPEPSNEVLVTLKNGKKAYFDNDTKKFIRYAE